MDERRRFTAAAAGLADPEERVADVAALFTAAFAMSGATVTTLGDPLGTETVSASDPRAAHFDEIQIDLAEGPSWQAITHHGPVLEPLLQLSINTGWPETLAAFQSAGLHALYSFPLVAGPLTLGALTLYSMTPGELSAQQLVDAGLLTAIVARQILDQALLAADLSAGDNDRGGKYSRREVHQATGMVLAQLRVTADDALLILRSHAFTNNRSVMDVAADVIARTLDFSSPPGTRPASPPTPKN